MHHKLLEKLMPVTEEEIKILEGGGIEKNIYSENGDFVIDSRKLLCAGKFIEIRKHTRFIHFPKHRHNYIEIVYMCSGSTTHIVNDDVIELKEGDLLFLNQCAVHEVMPAGENDIAINFIILPEFLSRIFTILEQESGPLGNFITNSLLSKKEGHSYLYFNVAGLFPIQSLVETLIWSITEASGQKLNVIQYTLALIHIYLINFSEKIHISPGGPKDKFMVSVLKYINEKYQSATLTELSQLLNYDLSWVSKEIKKRTGKTFKELLHEKKMTQAAHLLNNTTMSISDIIEIIGYKNSSFFFRQFKARYGMSPKQFRKQ